jgi:hypothetical protein
VYELTTHVPAAGIANPTHGMPPSPLKLIVAPSFFSAEDGEIVDPPHAHSPPTAINKTMRRPALIIGRALSRSGASLFCPQSDACFQPARPRDRLATHAADAATRVTV